MTYDVFGGTLNPAQPCTFARHHHSDARTPSVTSPSVELRSTVTSMFFFPTDLPHQPANKKLPYTHFFIVYLRPSGFISVDRRTILVPDDSSSPTSAPSPSPSVAAAVWSGPPPSDDDDVVTSALDAAFALSSSPPPTTFFVTLYSKLTTSQSAFSSALRSRRQWGK